MTGFENAGFDRFVITLSPADLADFIFSLVADGVRLWESQSDFQAWRILPGVNCIPFLSDHCYAVPRLAADSFHLGPTTPMPSAPSC